MLLAKYKLNYRIMTQVRLLSGPQKKDIKNSENFLWVFSLCNIFLNYYWFSGNMTK